MRKIIILISFITLSFFGYSQHVKDMNGSYEITNNLNVDDTLAVGLQSDTSGYLRVNGKSFLLDSVGIGTNSPSSLLYVNGNTTIKDTLTTSYVSSDGYDMGIMYLPNDMGTFGKLVDGTVTALSPSGTEHSYYFGIDGDSILKIYAKSDGAGGINSNTIKVHGELQSTSLNNNGTTYTMRLYNSGGIATYRAIDNGSEYHNSNTNGTFIYFQNSLTGSTTNDGTRFWTYNNEFRICNMENDLFGIRVGNKTRILLNYPRTISNNTSTTVMTIAYPSDSATNGNIVNGHILYTVTTFGDDGRQSETGILSYNGVEYNGTVTSSVIFSNTQQALSSGTLVTSATLTYLSGTWSLKMTTNSSLTNPIDRVTLNIMNGNLTVNSLP